MIRNVTIFSKMTFAVLSQATAESQRLYHRTQNTFNRIQNSLLTIEIHDQGKSISKRGENCNITFSQLKHHSAGRSQYQQCSDIA